MRILVADDEQNITRALKEILEKSKYTVDVVNNGEDALTYASEIDYDCIILDIMMPLMSGLQVVRSIRGKGIKTPVLLLTALDSPNDKVVGLDSGADDYLSKPFAVNELLARIRALLRRNDAYQTEIITIGSTNLDCGTCELSTNLQNVKLGNKEFQLMEFFMRNPHTVFSTETLMNRFWTWDSSAEINVVWTNIGYLRRKLESIGSDITIKSIRGLGYQLEEKQC